MKAVIVLCLMALAVARGDKNAEILRNDFKLNADDGSFQYDTETSNGIRARASGISYPGAEPEKGSYFIEGEYQYTDNEGKTLVVKYTADERGFRPQSEFLS